MKTFVKMGAFLIALVCITATAQAQKFGYVNSAAILSEMPEVKQMQSNLDGLRTQLEKKGKQMIEDFQTKQQDAAQKEQTGVLSPVQRETLLKELQAEEQNILKYQQESQQKLLEKEQELLKPIQDKIMKAIDMVAEEGGYQYIFDGSTGILLYADESTDLNDEVKAKMATL